MPSKTISITTAKWTRWKTAIINRHPIPTDEKGVDLFTENEWPFVYIKKLCAREVRAYEKDMQGKDNALPLDEDMVIIT